MLTELVTSPRNSRINPPARRRTCLLLIPSSARAPLRLLRSSDESCQVTTLTEVCGLPDCGTAVTVKPAMRPCSDRQKVPPLTIGMLAKSVVAHPQASVQRQLASGHQEERSARARYARSPAREAGNSVRPDANQRRQMRLDRPAGRRLQGRPTPLIHKEPQGRILASSFTPILRRYRASGRSVSQLSPASQPQIMRIGQPGQLRIEHGQQSNRAAPKVMSPQVVPRQQKAGEGRML